MQTPPILVQHLEAWLGVWTDDGDGVTVVGSPKRTEPGWDGKVRPVLGVSSDVATVISVAPEHVDAVRALGDRLDDVARGLPDAVGVAGGRFFSGVMRWTMTPTPGPDRGVWLPTDDPRVLPWLRPFNGNVLVGFAGDEIAAGVGRKIHDRFGHELAVVTEAAHRGEGWATDLVTQAARRVLDDGAIPTYLHSPDNGASARTADAAGFPDRGWRIHGVFTAPPG